MVDVASGDKPGGQDPERPQAQPDDTRWRELVVGVSVFQQRAIEALSTPALILDLPSRRIRAVNRAMADLVGRSEDEMRGRVNSEVIGLQDVAAMEAAVQAIIDGAINGYRARRRVVRADGEELDVVVWARLIELDQMQWAAYLVQRVDGADVDADAAGQTAWIGPVVVGTIDGEGRLERVSSEITDLLGWTPEESRGRSVLKAMHPDDIDGFKWVRSHSGGDGLMARHVRLRHRDGHWVRVQFLLAALGEGDEPRCAFTMLPDVEVPAPPADRTETLELHLRRIAAELRAAGVMDDIDRLPTAAEHPELNRLSSRQWQILVRLLRGERVPTMARELFVSQGTVRNHLSTIFAHFNVHSQAELLALLRDVGRRSARRGAHREA